MLLLLYLTVSSQILKDVLKEPEVVKTHISAASQPDVEHVYPLCGILSPLQSGL